MSLLSINVILALAISPILGTSKVIRVSTRHHEPYMYQNYNGTFTGGIELHMLLTMAKHWHMELEFKDHATEITANNIK